jgi:hypothetical protein
VTPDRHRARRILAGSALAFVVLAASALVIAPPAVEVALRDL